MHLGALEAKHRKIPRTTNYKQEAKYMYKCYNAIPKAIFYKTKFMPDKNPMNFRNQPDATVTFTTTQTKKLNLK